MKIGIDTVVCRKSGCRGYGEDQCRLFKEDDRILKDGEMKKCNFRIHHCPIPKKCPNKNLHIVRGTKLLLCHKKCPEIDK